MKRIDRLRNLMKKQGVSALVVNNLKNIYYLANFSGTEATILVTEKNQYFFTDARYTLIAKNLVKDFEIIESRTPLKQISDILVSEGIKDLQFESQISYGQFLAMKEELRTINLTPSKNLIEELRIIKDASEIETIRTACSISDRAFDELLNYLKPGLSELDLANFLDFKMREFGASSVSFETIVASGARSSMPHGVASNKIIEAGDTITLDFGCYYKHYVSDMTRTIFLGQPSDKMIEIYNTVLDSNNTLISETRAGLAYSDYDLIARKVIEGAGYGDNFTHGIGHGIGLDIHEDPFFGKNSKGLIKAGMTITDEPGIYIDNYGGVRIEDDLLVTEEGCELLTLASKDLIIL
ncbi:Xaa-Pro peptidase family protein [Streptococcaceae bacterium ESL0729]|nr:Xaa-Pro peptidase family protein [Streptococcaceae bacterium ESL0729]